MLFRSDLGRARGNCLSAERTGNGDSDNKARDTGHERHSTVGEPPENCSHHTEHSRQNCAPPAGTRRLHGLRPRARRSTCGLECTLTPSDLPCGLVDYISRVPERRDCINVEDPSQQHVAVKRTLRQTGVGFVTCPPHNVVVSAAGLLSLRQRLALVGDGRCCLQEHLGVAGREHVTRERRCVHAHRAARRGDLGFARGHRSTRDVKPARDVDNRVEIIRNRQHIDREFRGVGECSLGRTGGGFEYG